MTYYNGTSYSFTWQNGRQLASLTKGSSTYTFTYDAEGRRTSKQWSSGRTIQYVWDGDLLIAEYVANERNVTYTYDATGSPVGFTYTDLTGYYNGGIPCDFLYRKNPQGDIIGIVDSSGNEFVKYNYDAWGNLISYTMHGDDIYSLHYNMAEDNPFRYRGYYFDRETGFYYLKSRYYDPKIGRFISPDTTNVLTATPMGLTDKNLYAYCDNNPVVRVDFNGQFWDYVVDIGFLVWSVVDVINDPSDWKNWAALAVDVVFAVIPFVPSGVGQVIKAGNKIDNALDVANAINKVDNIQDAAKVTMIGRNMDRVTNTANLIGKADNLYEAWKGYDATATGIKRLLHNGISMAHNGGWLFGKLRQGYTVIDIGLSTMHKGRGLWYGTEKFVLGLWETRNIWKLPINYYF